MKIKSLAVCLAYVVLVMCSKDPVEENSSGVLAVPQNVLLTANTGTSLSFSWSKVEGAIRYAARLEDQLGKLVQQKNPTGTTIDFDELTLGKTYIFKVRSVADGQTSSYSDPLTVIAGESHIQQPPVEPDGPGNPENPSPSDPPGNPSEYYAQFKIPEAEDVHGKALAFPGAEGGGMYTSGGRGGKVIHVTTLADSGTGSLRAALNESGTRTIVFDVAGLIELGSTLNIAKGDVTVAGQTAPGDGICLKNFSTVVKADNVIIRFVRFRMGDEAKQENDAIWGRYQKNIILDHCSMSWSTDECSSFYANVNFTMQWCIMTESLCNSVHGKGAHGYGGIWGGKNASFHHNLLANHKSRNPRFDHPEIYDNNISTHRGNVDYRCNVVYNWGDNSSYGGEGAWLNMVNNYYKPGPASKDKKYFLDANGIYSSSGTNYGYPVLCVSGNIHTKYSDITSDNLVGVYWHDHKTNTPPDNSKLKSYQMSVKGPSSEDVYTTTHSAADAFARVCASAGASLKRDAVDQRACGDAQSGKATCTDGGNGSKNGIIDTQSVVGGWPSYTADAAAIARTADSDKDGMPDWFETQFGLNESDAADGNARTLDHKGRYTNLEMYLHYLVRDIVESQNEGGEYQKNS